MCNKKSSSSAYSARPIVITNLSAIPTVGLIVISSRLTPSQACSYASAQHTYNAQYLANKTRPDAQLLPRALYVCPSLEAFWITLGHYIPCNMQFMSYFAVIVHT